MKNAFRIYSLIEEENESGQTGVYLEECTDKKLSGEFVNEVECIHALRDNNAKGDFVILNVKSF